MNLLIEQQEGVTLLLGTRSRRRRQLLSDHARIALLPTLPPRPDVMEAAGGVHVIFCVDNSGSMGRAHKGERGTRAHAVRDCVVHPSPSFEPYDPKHY